MLFTRERLVEIVRMLVLLPAETETVEFKSNHLSPDRLGEYLSALANAATLNGEAHAFLILGISDDTHEIEGTTFDVAKTKGAGNEDLYPWLARLLQPSVYFDFEEVEVDGKRIVVIPVQAAASAPVAFKNVEYVRVGPHKKTLRQHPEREAKLWESFNSTPFELRSASGVLSEERMLSLLAYDLYFTLSELSIPASIGETIEVLHSAGFIVRADVVGWHITNMGALLLAKRLEDFPSLERKASRVIVYDGTSKSAPATEQAGAKGYAVGFVGLLNWIQKRTPATEVFESGIRRKRHVVSEKVIRELLANALIHQDLTVRGAGPMFEIFEDRLEVSNPGESLVPPIHLIDGQPRSRNEKLAKQMRNMGICDERGSGWDQIADFIEMSGLPAPFIESQAGYMRVTVYWDRGLDSYSKDEIVSAILFHAIVLHARKERLTNATVRRRFGLPDSDKTKTSKMIREGVEAGMIRVFDPAVGAKARSYVPFFAPTKA